MKKTLLFLAVVLMGLGVMAQTNTYTKITSASELVAGEKYLIVGYDEVLGYCAMSYQKTSNRHAIQVTEDGGSISLTPAIDPSSQTEAFEITLGGGNGAWTFFDELKNGYLYAANSSNNQLKTQTTNNANGEWNIAFEADGTAVVTAQGDNTRNVMRFNENSQNGSPLFNCYLPTSTAGVAVSFYKMGGSTIDPEPSEYPTNFNVTAERTNVTITWAQSAGAQLPRGYVVIGTTGSINRPVDGTPIANDLNGMDGYVAYNVMFGEGSCKFHQLIGNATWHFAIFPYTNSGATIDYKTDGTYPSANATIDDIYGLVYANFADGLAPFTAYSVEGDQAWTTSVYDGVPFAKMSGYAGSAHVNEDWLISPNLFAMGKFTTLMVSFKNAYNYDGNPLEVKCSYDYDGMSDPTEFGWYSITDGFTWSAGNYEWAESGELTIPNINDNRYYIAFVYTSTDAAASTWEVTDVQVYGTGFDAVEENEAVSFNIYPNPATNMISINATSAADVQIYDMAGRMVLSVDVVEGENAISVAELNSGVYFVRMNGAVVKFVKR